MRDLVGKFMTFYAATASISLAALVMFVVANLVLAPGLFLRSDSARVTPLRKYGMARMLSPGVYDGLTEREIRTLLIE